MATYTNRYRVDATFEDTIEAVTEALADEGFGVLADIDMQAAFDAKLDEEFDQYQILGACNPALAYEALDVEYELGALLPCNVRASQNHCHTSTEVFPGLAPRS